MAESNSYLSRLVYRQRTSMEKKEKNNEAQFQAANSKQVRDIEFGMKIKTSLLERSLAKVARLTEDIPLSVDVFK